jgi:ABC-type glycerol-3-phosphate transport system permease component
MEDKKPGFFEDTQDLLEAYISNRMQLIKMQTAEKSAKLVSLIFTGLVIVLLSFFILLFVSIMAGYFFAELTHSQFYGFGIVAAFYVILLGVVLYLRRRFLNKYISDLVVKIFFESTDEDDNDTGKQSK